MPSLSEADQKAILELARQAVVEAVCRNRRLAQIPTGGIFTTKRGAFVTLHVHKRLHGCIGVIDAREPLGESIAHCAMSAALHDPRFSPLRPEDLATLEIEVSLLSPLEPIRPEQIEIGKHGLLIEQSFCRGLLLPQVAVEHHLERERFLTETCYKAGLPGDAWKAPGTRLCGFTCEVFADPTFHEPQ
ncbi:MAG TPA: AmmeMemoRadiSam system protein A [Methylomirabilota bacterium]|nr:AmmeMemoRadiSam system protein A [Methylomirabilota bacterium]